MLISENQIEKINKFSALQIGMKEARFSCQTKDWLLPVKEY